MANEMQKTTPFGMRDKVGYMFGDFANDFTFILSSSFLMKFYTDVMGVSAGVVGMIMMIARFVDAFTDVTMGQIVDRSKPTKDGKFRPWLKRMCGPVAIASFLIFQSGLAGMSYGFKVAWLFVTYILWGSIFYTSVNIPYGSMASAISADPKDRAELSTWRTIGSTLASLVIGVGTPMVAYVTVNGQTVLSGSRMTIIAGVFSVCAILCYLLCFNLVRERVDVPANNSKMDIGKMLKSVFTNRACWASCCRPLPAAGHADHAGHGRLCVPQLLRQRRRPVYRFSAEQRADPARLRTLCLQAGQPGSVKRAGHGILHRGHGAGGHLLCSQARQCLGLCRLLLRRLHLPGLLQHHHLGNDHRCHR